ncbi:Uncharacterised protein [Mycobacteroides abscessus subsp. abscessus]|nr:Uncharacterised protein [Mycobacteroides abscessus subsp. abscessus]
MCDKAIRLLGMVPAPRGRNSMYREPSSVVVLIAACVSAPSFTSSRTRRSTSTLVPSSTTLFTSPTSTPATLT